MCAHFSATALPAAKKAIFTLEKSNFSKSITTYSLPLKLIFGEFAQDGLLGGQKAFPKKLIDNGFEFLYPNIVDALKAELSK